MPIIESTYIIDQEYTEFALELDLEVDAVRSKAVRPAFNLGLAFSVEPETSFNAETDFDLELEFELNAFLNNEPNVFTDDLDFDLNLELDTASQISTEALMLFDLGLKFELDTAVIRPEEHELAVTINILSNDPRLGNYIRQQGRLIVDGIDIPLVSWEVSESDNTSGKEIQVTLARFSDREFVEAGVASFSISDLTSSGWENEDIIAEDLIVNSVSSSISWPGDSPEDVVQITYITKEVEYMNVTSPRDLMIYDPEFHTFETSMFPKTFSSDGYQYEVELYQMNGLTLHSLMAVLFARMGFSEWQTNLPNRTITQMFIQMGEPLIGAINAVTGMFRPVIVADEGKIKVQDTTMMNSPGIGNLYEIRTSQYTAASTTKNRQGSTLDALRIRFVHNIGDYGQDSIIIDDPIVTVSGQGEDQITTTTRRSRRVFYRSSNPGLPYKENLLTESLEVQDYTGRTIYFSDEIFTYNTANRLITRTKTIDALVPEPSEESSSSSSSSSSSEAPPPVNPLNRISEETENLSYSSYQHNPRKVYCSRRSIITHGKYIVDSNNSQLGTPFKQELQVAFKSGNLEDGQTVQWGPLRTFIEEATPMAGDEVSIKQTDINHLLPLVSYNESQIRVGDMSESTFRTNQQDVLVFRNGSQIRTTGRVEPFHFGDVPIDHIIPLARRMLIKEQDKADSSASIETIGYDRALKKGTGISVYEREEKRGDYIITGRIIRGSINGIFMSLSGEEI